MTTDVLEGGGCKWLTTYEHAHLTGSQRRAEAVDVACCGCGLKVPYTESWVVVPFGLHGNRLPLPVFVHCFTCSVLLDAQVAFQQAWAKDAKAALPDPEKVAREAELNRLANPWLNPDLPPS